MTFPQPRAVLLCQTPEGPLLVFEADQVIGRSIATRGRFAEDKVSEVFAALAAHHGMQLRVFVDIGANIGTHLLYALDAGLADHAVGIEADPNNFALLKANVGLRGHAGRTRLFQCALSQQRGVVELELCPSNYGDHRVRVAGLPHEPDLGESTREVCSVAAVTADELFRLEGVNLHRALVWMDTQGHEGHILEGGQASLGLEAPAVVLEFWPYGLNRAGGKTKYFEFLERAGAIYDINRADWPTTGRVGVAELMALYDCMLAETRLDHYPHTDLLCVRAAVNPPERTSGMNAQMNELQRSLMTISCRDADIVPKVAGAGRTIELGNDKVQVMHNGLKVLYGGYYGEWMAHIIRGLNGHHEPQEELLFHNLLRYVRDGTRIVELGSFWAYYSLWYLQVVPGSTALCVEPDVNHLKVGVKNAELNAMTERTRFLNAWVGGAALSVLIAGTETSTGPQALPVFNAPALLDHAGGDIELLHLDIQGAELALLRSIDAAISPRVRFVMVSTHHSSISGSPTIHGDCVEALRALGASILVEHDVVESYSGDGLILASFLPEDRGLNFPPISRNRAETSLFREA